MTYFWVFGNFSVCRPLIHFHNHLYLIFHSIKFHLFPKTHMLIKNSEFRLDTFMRKNKRATPYLSKNVEEGDTARADIILSGRYTPMARISCLQ